MYKYKNGIVRKSLSDNLYDHSSFSFIYPSTCTGGHGSLFNVACICTSSLYFLYLKILRKKKDPLEWKM